MSDQARSLSEAVGRFVGRDPTLKFINLYNMRYTDAEVAELVDCLLAHPDVVVHLRLHFNQLTDETGIKLARYLAASSTIETLGLAGNRFGEATYLGMAAALRVNSSLRDLSIFSNQAVDRSRIDAAFVEALRLNPDRPAGSDWQMYFNWWPPSHMNDFTRLWDAAELDHPHPSLQSLLLLLISDQQSNENTRLVPTSSGCIMC